MTHKVGYCKKGLVTRHRHFSWNLNHFLSHVSTKIELIELGNLGKIAN